MPQNQNFRLPTHTLNNYYPYGMLQAGRSRNAGGYRFGFNGMENDNKKGGLGEHVDFGARGLNTWTGKFYGIDPLWAKYPSISPYAFVANSPLRFVEVDGRYFTGDIDLVKATIAKLQVIDTDEARQQLEMIRTLDQSEVEFNISRRDKSLSGAPTGGITEFNFEKNRVDIIIHKFEDDSSYPATKEERTLHELRHGKQFLEGSIDFVQDSEGNLRPGDMYSKQTEREGLQSQKVLTDERLKSSFDFSNPLSEKEFDVEKKLGGYYKLVDPKMPIPKEVLIKKQEYINSGKVRLIKKYITIHGYTPNEQQKQEPKQYVFPKK